MNPRAMWIRTAGLEVMAAVALLRGTLIVPLVLARAHRSAVVTAFHRDGGHQVMNVVVRGTRGAGAVVPGVTQCGRAAPARRLHHVRVPELVHVLRRIHLTRGTVGAGLGLGPLVGEGVTAGKTSETVGPGPRHKFLVSTIAVQNYTELPVSILPHVEKILSIQLLEIDESSARMGPYSASFLIAWDIHSSSSSC